MARYVVNENGELIDLNNNKYAREAELEIEEYEEFLILNHQQKESPANKRAVFISAL